MLQLCGCSDWMRRIDAGEDAGQKEAVFYGLLNNEDFEQYSFFYKSTEVIELLAAIV